ncbi:MAG: type II secretion system F family protein [Lachnospiraceae bacterium]|nr:type II secretion system F family protein [Lachnospiraceae bacterium]
MKKEMKMDPYLLDKIGKMHPGKDAKALTRAYYERKKKLCLLTIFAGILLSGLMFLSESGKGRIDEEGKILRQDYGGEEVVVDTVVESECYGKRDVTVSVSPRTHTKEELPVLFSEAFSYLQGELLGENESLQRVTKDLCFPDSYAEDQVQFEYLSSDYAVLDTKGHVHNEELSEETKVTVEVTMYYGEESKKEQFEVCVCPRVLGEEEAFYAALEQELRAEDAKSVGNETFALPETVEAQSVVFAEKKEHGSLLMLALTFLCALALFKGMDRDVEKNYEKRQQELLFAYPDFTGKLALLTGAGMSVTSALRKIFADGSKTKDSALIEELGIYVRSMDNGMLEEQALAGFSARVGLPQYRKCISLIATNVKKGSVNLGELLEQEAEDAFVEHQSSIRKMGEEAGTKLLIPMVMMLSVVMVLIMVPAFLNYQV